MTILWETPVPALFVGVIVEVILVVVLFQTGRARLLIPIVIVPLIVICLIVAEAFVVTDREEVAEVLDSIAAALEANDPPGLEEFISPTHGQKILQEVRTRLAPWRVEDGHVGRDLEVEVNRLTVDPTALATFTGRVKVSEKSGTVRDLNYVRKFTVKLRRENDRWLVYDYEDRNVIGPGAAEP